MKIAFNETSEVQLKHPVTNEPLFILDKNGKQLKDRPMVAVIYGKHTSVYKNAETRMVKALQKLGKDVDTGKADEKALDLLVSCTEKFVDLDIETENGKLDPSDVRGVLKEAFWIRGQIDKAIMDLENFSQAS